MCTHYRKDKNLYSELPFGPSKLTGFTPVYEEIPGWQEEIQSARKWEDLPLPARTYVLRIEELTGIQVRLVSVGPERDQVVDIY